jgi:hypothetical protein
MGNGREKLMDDRRFDALTKALVAAKPSRRVALRRLAGGTLATVFGGVSLKGASARRVGIEAKTCGQVCDVDGDCNAGLRCGTASDECFAILDSRDDCDNNGDCSSHNETCSDNGKCVNTVGDCRECRKDNDCDDATRVICSDGKCVECKKNNDCNNDEKCKKNKCVKKN